MNNAGLITDMMENNETLNSINELLDQILSTPDELLTPEAIQEFKIIFDNFFTLSLKERMVQTMIDSFKHEHFDFDTVQGIINDAQEGLDILVNINQPTPEKRELINIIFLHIHDIFTKVAATYTSSDIKLKIQLEEGAQIPTYARPSDAAADLYINQDTVLAPHSLSNKVHTGVHIGLPEGWMAFIFPRSSTGAKTGLRLSNSVGVIDNHYTGELILLFDNHSDSAIELKAGERLAQLMIVPSYHFEAQLVDKLEATDRNDSGFGSTGK